MSKTTEELTRQDRDAWTGLLDHYRQTAVRMLGIHHQAGTTCESCGQSWPCRDACSAELALEL